MICSYRALLVILALNVPMIGRTEEPAAAASSSKADGWPALEWKKAAPSPFARVESPAAVVDGKIYLFGGFTEDLDASNRLDVYDPASDSWTLFVPQCETTTRVFAWARTPRGDGHQGMIRTDAGLRLCRRAA